MRELKGALAWLAAAGLFSIPACSDHGEVGVYVSGSGGQAGVPSVLAARIEVTGNHAPCGQCATVVAVVTGGVPPYSYAWTDPALAGPGPHLACPRQDERYSVVVTDGAGATAGGRTQNAVGSALLECTPTPSDAGAGGGLNGCVVVQQRDPISCGTDDGASSTRVEFAALEPGRYYQYTYTQLFPIGLGMPSTADVYLGMNPCERTQKVFTLKLDSVATQDHCFAPDADYRYSTTVIHVNGIPLTFGVTATVCDSCLD